MRTETLTRPTGQGGLAQPLTTRMLDHFLTNKHNIANARVISRLSDCVFITDADLMLTRQKA